MIVLLFWCSRCVQLLNRRGLRGDRCTSLLQTFVEYWFVLYVSVLNVAVLTCKGRALLVLRIQDIALTHPVTLTCITSDQDLVCCDNEKLGNSVKPRFCRGSNHTTDATDAAAFRWSSYISTCSITYWLYVLYNSYNERCWVVTTAAYPTNVP